jgi:hypothetical protein
MRALLMATLLAAPLLLPGCDAPRSRVHGTVKVQGRPVTGGTIIFQTKDPQAFAAELKADGSYEVSGLPRGTIRVSVQPLPPKGPGKSVGGPGGAAPDPAKQAPPDPPPPPGPVVPTLYADANTSGLSFELKDQDQEYSVDLK